MLKAEGEKKDEEEKTKSNDCCLFTCKYEKNRQIVD